MRGHMSYLSAGTLVLIFWLLAFTAAAQTNNVITFNNRIETITNLQGRVYLQVKLVRADLDGVVYFSDSGGGRISYTNLPPETLEGLGIDTNRIAIAAERAAMSAEERKADYARRMQRAAANIQQFEQQSQAQAQADTNGTAGGNGTSGQKHTHKKNSGQPSGQTTPPPSN